MTARQDAFIEYYLRSWNATDAARKAKYAHPNNAGPRLLLNASIQAKIQARLQELQMDTDEVLLRLTEQARGKGAKYIEHTGVVNLAKIIQDGNEHLVKGTKFMKDGTLNVELYDAQSALDKIARIKGMYQPEQELPDVHVHVDGFTDLIERLYGDDKPDD